MKSEKSFQFVHESNLKASCLTATDVFFDCYHPNIYFGTNIKPMAMSLGTSVWDDWQSLFKALTFYH